MTPSDRQSEHGPFVGRIAELEAWKKVLEDPSGQAVLVTGQAGMGKTALLRKMANVAEVHPSLKCGCVRYEVTPTDAPDSTMALMLDNAWDAADIEQKSLDTTPRRLEQWRSFLNVFKIGDLVMSFRRDPTRSTRDQFLNILETISNRLDPDARLLVFVDPEKLMPVGSAGTWRLVTRDLPDKIKLIFAQRLEDQLVGDADFGQLENLVRIPGKSLSELSEEDVGTLVETRHSEFSISVAEAKQAVIRYVGYPIAVDAALDLLATGSEPTDLPDDPKDMAAEQWKRAHEIGGESAWKLMTAYAVLDVAVPDEVVLPVAELTSDDLRAFRNQPFLRGMLREEPGGSRLYHVLVQDHRIHQLSEEDANEYHNNAINIYRLRLTKQAKPDALAAIRLPVHVLAAEGDEAFARCLLNECEQPLHNLGLLDESILLHQQALSWVKSGTQQEAALNGNLGVLYKIRGDLEQAEIKIQEALDIYIKHKCQDGMARQYGKLGLIYQTRGELHTAEKMYLKSLNIEIKRNDPKGLANAYSRLGMLYKMCRKLTKATELLQKSLEINKSLNDSKGIAGDYSSLALIAKEKTDLDEAEELFLMSLKISEDIEWHECIASSYSNLGLIYQKRNMLLKAKDMMLKSLTIGTQLGHLESIAADYQNLGHNAIRRGDLLLARDYWIMSRDLFKKIGMSHLVNNVQGWLDRLPDKSHE